MRFQEQHKHQADLQVGQGKVRSSRGALLGLPVSSTTQQQDLSQRVPNHVRTERACMVIQSLLMGQLRKRKPGKLRVAQGYGGIL